MAERFLDFEIRRLKENSENQNNNNNNNNNNNKTYIAPISIRLFSSALKNVKLETI